MSSVDAIGKNEPTIKEYKSAYWHVKFISNFINQSESEILNKKTEHLFTKHGKIQKRRTNLTMGLTDGMTYKVNFGYGENRKETIRKTLAYNIIPELSNIKEKLEQLLEVKFPMCALLRYPNGNYGIKRHRDKEVPKGSIIVGLSVGETRTLTISSPQNNIDPLKLELSPGSLYIFYPPTNDRAFHCIETESNRLNPRISFTFRTNWTS